MGRELGRNLKCCKSWHPELEKQWVVVLIVPSSQIVSELNPRRPGEKMKANGMGWP
jgi:hypothetical protein